MTQTVADIIKIKRALQHVSDDVIKEFILSLESSQVRWLISNYLNQFTPHHSKKKLQTRELLPSINKIHYQRLKDIKNNSNDNEIFNKMEQIFVNSYFNNLNRNNPLSINTINKKVVHFCTILIYHI